MGGHPLPVPNGLQNLPITLRCLPVCGLGVMIAPKLLVAATSGLFGVIPRCCLFLDLLGPMGTRMRTLPVLPVRAMLRGFYVARVDTIGLHSWLI